MSQTLHSNNRAHVPADAETSESANETTASRKPLSPAAQRALAEAEERRAQRDKQPTGETKEYGGQAGPDPVRYGDWEKGGIASDF